MKSFFKLLLFSFLIFTNLISASTKSNFISSNLLEKTAFNTFLDPVIVVSPSTLVQFTSCLGSASQSQTFTVSGSGLSSDIAVTAPTGYEISKDSGVTWVSSLILIFNASGDVGSTTILVRLKASASPGQNNGTVTINPSVGQGSTNNSIKINLLNN